MVGYLVTALSEDVIRDCRRNVNNQCHQYQRRVMLTCWS